MDVLTIIGILVGFGAIIGGNWLEGGHLDSLLQATAFLIVLGGTVGAVLVQSRMPIFVRAMKMAAWAIRPPVFEGEPTIEKIIHWSQVARKEGLLGLESIGQSEEDGFARKGLQLLVDGTEPDAIRQILEVEIGARESRDLLASKVFEGMGGYAPTIGIIGAVMGLIHVMNNLSDPSRLGPGIAVAFVATIYGVGSANMLFLPLASKLKAHVKREAQFREMMVEGIVSISRGENPRNIDTKLRGYLD